MDSGFDYTSSFAFSIAKIITSMVTSNYNNIFRLCKMIEGGYGSHEIIGTIGEQNREQLFSAILIDSGYDYDSCFAFVIAKIITSVVAINCNNSSDRP